MNEQHFMHRSVLRFKRFTRKGYALFACLGREVVIATLSVATLTYAKADGISVKREDMPQDSLRHDEVKLDEVVVTGSRTPLTQLQSAKMIAVVTRADIQQAAAESINDILSLVTGVDVRQRGGFGVQTDISLRGGNFDQITILLNGVNISSPHTGHLSADFPVSPDDIERIEVLEGPAARVYGTSAFNGVINIVTRGYEAEQGRVLNMGDAGIDISAFGGQYGTYGINTRLFGAVDNGKKGISVSLGHAASDGATPNSAFSSRHAFSQIGASFGTIKVDMQAGLSYKPYEANTFYGASSTDQWESNERQMIALKADAAFGKVHIMPLISYNRWFDHYQWHRNSPSGENYHDVASYTAALNGWVQTSLGRTSIGMELRRETIWSTKLGRLKDESEWRQTLGHDARKDLKYKYFDGRNNLSGFVEHNVLIDKWTFAMGLLLNRNTALDNHWRIYPGIDVSWRPADYWKLFASWNMAMRMPTFTDLYYSGANIIGNSSLNPEKTSDITLGARYSGKGMIAEVQVFKSSKEDMIDWVMYEEAGDDNYHSVNFQMDNYGVQFHAMLMPQELFNCSSPLRKLDVQYAYIEENSDYAMTVIQSKYAMDYLRHKVVVRGDFSIWRQLGASLTWRWQDRTGDQNKDYALLDARLYWKAKSWSVYIDCTNILDHQYFDYISVPQPGRWLRGGIKIAL